MSKKNNNQNDNNFNERFRVFQDIGLESHKIGRQLQNETNQVRVKTRSFLKQKRIFRYCGKI